MHSTLVFCQGARISKKRPANRAPIIRIPGWLTVKEAAEVLGCSPGQIRWYVVKGYLKQPARLTDAEHAMMLFKESEILAYKADHPRIGKIRAENLKQKALAAKT